MKKNFSKILIIIVATTLIQACIKVHAVYNTVTINVTGVVIDTVKNIKIANQKVILVSCYAQGLTPLVCGNLVASTTTDSSGKFEFNITAQDTLGFQIRAVLDSNYYFPFSQSEQVIPNKTNVFTLYAREINYVKGDIKVDNNPFNRIFIDCGNTYYIIYGNSIDTTLYFKILPNAQNVMMYSVFDSAYGKDRMLLDTIQTTLADTMYLYLSVSCW